MTGCCGGQSQKGTALFLSNLEEHLKMKEKYVKLIRDKGDLKKDDIVKFSDLGVFLQGFLVQHKYVVNATEGEYITFTKTKEAVELRDKKRLEKKLQDEKAIAKPVRKKPAVRKNTKGSNSEE